MSENPFVDDRDRQGTLDVGEEAARTEGRESSLLGSDAFADDREGGSDGGEQFNLFGEEEELDGQASLGGGQATRESEGFFDLSGRSSGGSGDAFELSADAGSLFESAFGTPDEPPEGGALGSIGGNIRAAESAGALSPDPNGDAAQAPDGLFAPSNGGGDTAGKQKVDVQSLDSAGAVREQYSEYLHPDDNRGRTTVQFVGDVPDGVIRQARAAADETAADRARSQTTSLTEREREQIKSIGGFTQSRTTANWRSAKGVFEREGLGDQFRDAIGSINDYDDPIEGAEAYVERHKARQAEAGVGGVGAMDVGETDIQQRQRAGRAAAREQESLEASAIEGAKRGHQEAIDALVLEAGWDRAEAEALGQKVDDPRDSMTEPEFQRIVDAEIKRSRSSGRFAHDTNQTTLPGVNRRQTSGRFVSSPLADTEIGRNTETGRFVDRGDR
ncbi:hypothetical protein PM023_15990 [Halorubrum ezzemoulense]|uniref:hypothetical protein n=1 Tax=Halorubrum ezzemoulense TaxID=337243 RepID=UPI00232B4AF3|nr:hypothetical protein [Halorubrum ezzemoulense]MDB2226147.1 hypothetical protein [Halorubrum ezzemoulense]